MRTEKRKKKFKKKFKVNRFHTKTFHVEKREIRMKFQYLKRENIAIVCRIVRNNVWGDDVEKQIEDLNVGFSSEVVKTVLESLVLVQPK